MTLVKRNNDWNPLFPSFFDDLWGRDLMDFKNTNFSNTNTTLPAVNIVENDNEYLIELAAPGMKKDDFNLKLENNNLIISSEKKNEKEDKSDGKYSRKEFSYQSFQRSFSIPENSVDNDKIDAKYNNGILCITLPKREESKPKPAREIKIK